MVQASILIRKSAADIWEALTNKQAMKVWYFDIPDFELRPGATFTFYEPGENKAFLHECLIQDIVEFEKFEHTWRHPTQSKGTSVVTWTIKKQDDGCIVNLAHRGIENFADGGEDFAEASYQAGWDSILYLLKNYVYGFKKLKYEIDIKASAQTVWNALWEKESYKQWSSAFAPGSHYEGEIAYGSRLYFLNAENDGIYGDLVYCRPPFHAMIQLFGEIKNGVEQAQSEKAERWAGACESYTLKENSGYTTLYVEMDSESSAVGYYDEVFPNALAMLKKIVENTN